MPHMTSRDLHYMVEHLDKVVKKLTAENEELRVKVRDLEQKNERLLNQYTRNGIKTL